MLGKGLAPEHGIELEPVEQQEFDVGAPEKDITHLCLFIRNDWMGARTVSHGQKISGGRAAIEAVKNPVGKSGLVRRQMRNRVGHF